MPRSLATHLHLLPLLVEQDYVVSREQALAHGMSRSQIEDRLASRAWQLLMPAVYLASPGSPTRRQMLIGALLWAGDDAAIDDVDACRFHGVKAVPIDHRIVHVVVPWGSQARSRGYVVVRRTTRMPAIVATERLRYVDTAAAVIATARRLTSERAALALISDAVQRRLVSPAALMQAHIAGPPRNARRTDLALAQVIAGIRSVPEADFRGLAEHVRAFRRFSTTDWSDFRPGWSSAPTRSPPMRRSSTKPTAAAPASEKTSFRTCNCDTRS